MDKDWIIFYDDESIIDSDTDIREAPRLGVQVITQYNKKTGYDKLIYDDYYVYDSERGGWRGTDVFGVWDHLVECKTPLVMFGRNLSDEHFKRITEKVQSVCGPKSAWMRRESFPRKRAR